MLILAPFQKILDASKGYQYVKDALHLELEIHAELPTGIPLNGSLPKPPPPSFTFSSSSSTSSKLPGLVVTPGVSGGPTGRHNRAFIRE
jgi:hypothetical protein